MLNYEYNVRGWLKSINKDYTAGTTNNNWFGQTLNYDHGFNAQQFNGNISGMQGRSKGDGEKRAFGFTYDKVNRLTSGDFTQNTGGGWNTSAGLDFTASNLTYDANGNILTMNQKGWKLGGSLFGDNYRAGKMQQAREWADDDAGGNSVERMQAESLGKGESTVGALHSHQYADGTEGATFSPEDAILGLFGKTETEGNFMMVEAGNTRFALVVTDPKKASSTLSMLKRQTNADAYSEGYEKGQTFQENLINAVLGVVGDGSKSSITFYMTTDKEKVRFSKVEPPKPPPVAK